MAKKKWGGALRRDEPKYTFATFLKKDFVGPLLLGLVFTAFALMTAYFGALELSLYAIGESADATVSNQYIDRQLSSDKDTKYYTEYSFDVTQGEQTTRHVGSHNSNSASVYSRYDKGDSIAVLYLPSYPEYNRVPDSIILPLVMTLFFAIALFLAFACFKHIIKHFVKALRA